ncbi:MAG: helix-hairpin-helix domain-containing protein [Flavobacteriales bacterium]|nr:helix-hairpin-helix domain-containing protein [Flavobacteriales bacterium]
MKKFLIILFVFNSILIFSQNIEDKTSFLEQTIEQIAENSEEEIDFTELFENLEFYYKNPINLNNCNREDLKNLYILNSFQIEKLFSHIQKNGKLISYLELQSVRGFDIETIQLLLPFIRINEPINTKNIVGNLQQYILIRDERNLQTPKGFIIDETGEKYYLGTKNRSLFRYRLQNKYLQAGITAEKDKGETFFGEHQKFGYDFYSAHLRIRNVGRIETAVIGDYNLQFGQGISIFGGIGFGKSSEVIDIQKTGNIIRPHTSSDENRFFRGASFKLKLSDKFDIITFYSFNKVDANITDTTEGEGLIFTSLQNSGMHRTENELLDKNAIKQQHFGLHSNYKIGNGNLGFSYINNKILGDYDKDLGVYNQFDLDTNINSVLSTDYQYLYKNLNFFGEFARSQNGGTAQLHGVLIGLDKTLSASFMYRDYDRSFQNNFAASFAESETQNEKGMYSGLEFKPNLKWKFRAYIDFYQYPWLRYYSSTPTFGKDYFIQSDYKINRNTKLYFRYKTERKEENFNIEDLNTPEIGINKKEVFRFNSTFKEGESWNFKNRIEYCRVKNIEGNENGFMIYQDVKYKPLFSKVSFSTRLTIFNTESYNSRIYAYESDVLYGYSIPSFYGKGRKFYVVLKFNILKDTDLWIKYSETIYNDRDVIRSGWDEIEGNRLTEIKLQLQYKF